MLPHALPPAGFAPLLGFCLHLAIAAPLLGWIGFSTPTIVAVTVLLLAAVWLWHRRQLCTVPVKVGWGAPLAAGLIAAMPLLGVLPKGSRLSEPIFDHAKIAIVESIARLGLPVTNPFFVTNHPLGYYWWWHFAAAELARITGLSGWTADAALTGATSFMVLLALAALAEAMARGLGVWAVALALPASMRPFLLHSWLAPESGLGGVLNQASWAPQHLMATGALILAIMLLAGLADSPSIAGVLALAACIAAGFGCSAWVGGIVCAAAAPIAALVLAWHLPARRRVPFARHAAAAGALAIALVARLLLDQHAAAASWGRSPIQLAAYPIFGAGWWDLAGLPLLLAVEFPVATILGGAGLWAARRTCHVWQAALLAAAAASLTIMAVVRGALVNNDLGWRAALLPLLALLPFAAATVRSAFAPPVLRARAAAVAALPLLGLWSAWIVARDDLIGHPAPPGPTLAQEAALWRAVRAATPPTARILSDPRLDAARTVWPANIGWALLSNRASCFGGWASVQAFAPMPHQALAATATAVNQVFDAAPMAADLALARQLHCTALLLTAASPIWSHDPFVAAGVKPIAAGPAWRLYALQEIHDR